jgi:hypothetical protein
MNKFILPFIMLAIGIISFVGLALIGKNSTFSDIKKEDKCKEKDQNIKDGHTCGVWSNGDCLKGKWSSGDDTCTKQSSMAGIALLVVSFVFIIAFIVTLIMAFMKK